MTANTSRRAFFRGLVGRHSAQSEVRPPGAIQEDSFVQQCERCEICANACPQKIIVRGDGGFPTLDFTHNGCTGCGQCSQQCPSGALVVTENPWPKAQIAINDACLSYAGISCQSCKDSCDHKAITFPMTRSVPTPALDQDACTACGDCIGVCPSKSITALPITAY